MPPFLIPVIAFFTWFLAALFYLPVLRLDSGVSDQLVAPLFFISPLVLIFSWAISGPALAAILSSLSALAVLYLALAAKKSSLFLQFFVEAGLFTAMAFYFYRIQQGLNDKRLEQEKIIERLNLNGEELAKKENLKKALELKISHFLDLQKLSDDLKGVQGAREAAQKIVKHSREVLPRADECVLYLVDEEKQELYAQAASPEGCAVDSAASVFERWAMKRYQPIVVEDTRSDFRFSTVLPSEARSGRAKEDGRMRSVCVSPLVTEKKVIGVIRAGSAKPHAFTTDDLRLLDILSGLGAVTLKNTLLYEKMGELAIRDSLTGLYVHRYFQERLAEELHRARLNKTVFSVLLLDIDFFKRYNDEFGHAAGDIVLRNVASILLRCVSQTDLAARYGGEEFVLLLPNRPLREAAGVAEHIRGEIESYKFLLRRIESRVTTSIGVASFPDGGRTGQELLATADRNLYEAKRLGRNRVCGGI